MKMNRGLLLSVTVAVGSFLQGWFYVLLSGYPSYMRKELHLETEPAQDSVVWFLSCIGILLAALSGRVGGVGRRPLLIFSSLLYLFSSVVMPLSGNITLILVARLLAGFASGFTYILLVFYFMETASGMFLRYLLPQFASLCGMCLSSVVDGWNLIFNIAFSLSLLYFVLVVFFLHESPKWLVRKGRVEEARNVLQKLRGSQDVSDEMYVLIYSVRLERATSVEDLNDEDLEYGPEDLSSDNLTKPVIPSTASPKVSITSENATLTDSLLTPAGNVDEDSLTREGVDSTSNADTSVLTTRVLN